MTSSGWQLAEGSAVAYDRHLVPVFMDPWAADLVERVGVAAGQRVLDVGCGTGVVARHAAARGAEVTGVDLNEGMLAVARDRSAAAGAAITWRQASADALPLPDGAFDVVLCQQALQFMPDRPAALAELFRVARPGARLGVGTCRPVTHQPAYARLADALGRHLGVQVAEAIRSPYTLGDGEELRALVEKAGFAETHLRVAIWTARFASAEALLRAETSSSPLGDVVSELDPDVQQALIEEVDAALRAYVDDDGLVFPFETNVLTATR